MRPAHLILRADDLRQVDLLGIAAQENLRRAAHPRTAASDGFRWFPNGIPSLQGSCLPEPHFWLAASGPKQKANQDHFH